MNYRISESADVNRSSQSLARNVDDVAQVVDITDSGSRIDVRFAARVHESPEVERPISRWWRPYQGALLLSDTLALVVACVVAISLRFPGRWLESASGTDVAYLAIALGFIPVWLMVVALRGGYDARCIGVGGEEFRRVMNAGVGFVAVVAVVAIAANAAPARKLVAIALPLNCLLAVALRFVVRKFLHRIRQAGNAVHRVVVVGEGSSQAALVERLRSSPWSGLKVVATSRPHVEKNGHATLSHVPDVIREHGADTVAVAHSPHVTSAALRTLAWQLEGSRVNLMLAPALTDVAGPRVQVRPVSGVPLLQLTEPRFEGGRRLLKAAFDRVGALVIVALLSPLMLAVALAVRLSGPGPVVFRQQRVGLRGRSFTLLKFRSMVPDAERRAQELRGSNDHGEGHVLFKMTDDPRVTAVGRFLRRYSLDELPQLLNVVAGSMSLVGPRPQLPAEVAQYDGYVHRRLLVQPGITGLWQVSGRSDLDWDETVRLDLYYVENWSPLLDMEILWKTMFAVVKGAGAR